MSPASRPHAAVYSGFLISRDERWRSWKGRTRGCVLVCLRLKDVRGLRGVRLSQPRDHPAETPGTYPSLAYHTTYPHEPLPHSSDQDPTPMPHGLEPTPQGRAYWVLAPNA